MVRRLSRREDFLKTRWGERGRTVGADGPGGVGMRPGVRVLLLHALQAYRACACRHACGRAGACDPRLAPLPRAERGSGQFRRRWCPLDGLARDLSRGVPAKANPQTLSPSNPRLVRSPIGRWWRSPRGPAFAISAYRILVPIALSAPPKTPTVPPSVSAALAFAA